MINAFTLCLTLFLTLSLDPYSVAFAQLTLRPTNDPSSAIPNDKKFASNPVVVLVSIDGMRHDYPALHKMKTFLEIEAQGTSAKGLTPVFPSKTFPNHYSIVTGLYPKNHNILENNFYDPKTKKHYSPSDPFTVRDGKWYGGLPLWILAEMQGLRTASYFWVGSEAQIKNHRPTYYFPFDSNTSNNIRIKQILSWTQLPIHQRPGLITAYFSLLDNAGHDFGPASAETKAACQEVDLLMKDLWSGLKNTSVPFVLVIVSDHGMASLEESKKVRLENYIDPAEFEIEGSGSFVFLYKKQNTDLSHALGSLRKLEPNVSAFTKDEIPEIFGLRGHPMAGDIVLIAKQPWYMELPKRKNGRQAGSHGWSADEPDMQGVFYAVGNKIPKGLRLDRFENIHIYPWIARLMNLKITEKIDGDDRLIKTLEAKSH